MSKLQVLIIDDDTGKAEEIAYRLINAGCQVTRVTPDRVASTESGTMICLDSIIPVSIFKQIDR